MLQVVLPPREEAVARRTEALPHGLLVPAADGANLLPVGLQPLDFRRGLHPIGRVRQRLGALAQRQLGDEVRRALLVLGGRVGECPREALVLRGLDPPPHGLALRARRERHLLPAGLQLAHPPARRLEVLLGLERLHLLAELFLHLQVRPALPLVGVAQFLHARPERGARGFEPRLQLLPVPLRLQRGAILDRGLHVPQRAVTSLQRHLLRRGPRASKARHASWKRRVSDAAYSDGIGGSPSHRTFSSAMRSIAAGSPPRPSISWQMATRSACSRATASARSRSAARSCCRSAIASRTASDADSNCCARAPSTTTSAWNSAQAS